MSVKMLIREEAAISFLEESERPRRGLINLPIDCAKHMNRADAMFVDRADATCFKHGSVNFCMRTCSSCDFRFVIAQVCVFVTFFRHSHVASCRSYLRSLPIRCARVVSCQRLIGVTY